jgi:hypothetical protein
MLLELADRAPPSIYTDYQALVNGTSACSLDAVPEASQLLRLWARIQFKLADHGTFVTHSSREAPLRSHVWAALTVKGHATKAGDVDEASAWMKPGNDQADSHAKRGARMHGVNDVAIEEARFGMKEARCDCCRCCACCPRSRPAAERPAPSRPAATCQAACACCRNGQPFLVEERHLLDMPLVRRDASVHQGPGRSFETSLRRGAAPGRAADGVGWRPPPLAGVAGPRGPVPVVLQVWGLLRGRGEDLGARP